jgi:transcriptional regulator GlxA family with amidase domain
MLPASRSFVPTLLTRAQVDDEAFAKQIQDPRIRQALKFLRQKKTPKLSEVATRLNLSTSRLRHLFKKELGVSPKHYVTLLRLRWAKQLLENSWLEVKEVTAIIGVNDVSHFGRTYKAVFRQTPSQTRALAPSAAAGNRAIAISAKK